MLFARIKRLKNRKGVTLVEMVVAMAIVAILATVLSMMIVPVMNAYTINETQTRLAEAVDSRLNDMAMYLRGATGVYLPNGDTKGKRTWTKNSKPSISDSSWYPGEDFTNTDTSKMYKESNRVFPEIRSNTTYRSEAFKGLRQTCKDYGGGVKRMYCFVLDNYYEQKDKSDGYKNYQGYLYPEFIVADWSGYEVDANGNVTKSERKLDYASEYDMKLSSDDYQEGDKSIRCPDNSSMWFYVRKNPDDGDSLTVLEMHLKMQKGDVTYEGTKTVVCENLVVQGRNICTDKFDDWGTDGKQIKYYDATVSTVAYDQTKAISRTNLTPYFAVWFLLKA